MANKITESSSLYRHLDKMSTAELLSNINQEDQKVAIVVQEQLPAISALVDAVYDKMKDGGRLFYIGAGTSGRLGIVDASECPPTFGVPHDWVIGLMAGGDGAMRKAVEFAEDQADIVVGIAASGSTPYVLHGLQDCRKKGILTGSISCNPDAPISDAADYPIEVVVGPEFVTGSTRMKSGTAQKLVLNMLTTSVMIKLGRVKDNRMVDMQLSNNKLVDRGTKMIVAASTLEYDEAKELLLKHGNVREALNHIA
jgi:N-acetylmuramic acid 6-phosphate etherase